MWFLMSELSLREARPTDVVKYARFASPRFFYGLIAEKDGERIGAGIIVWGDKNRPFLCLDISPELRKHKMVMHRIGSGLAKAGAKACKKLYTIQDKDEPTASRWLAQLGFIQTDEQINGEWVWLRS